MDINQISEFITNHWALFVSLAVILVLLIGGEIQRLAGGAKHIDSQEATRLINHNDAVMIDIRDDGQFRSGHILNAINMPKDKLDAEVGKLKNDKPVIAYCRTGQQSAGFCSRLRKKGFQEVYNLKGGIMAWRNANLPITNK